MSSKVTNGIMAVSLVRFSFHFILARHNFIIIPTQTLKTKGFVYGLVTGVVSTCLFLNYKKVMDQKQSGRLDTPGGSPGSTPTTADPHKRT